MPSDHIVGYADKLSVAPGETIRLMLSAVGTTTASADIVRIRCGDLNPQGPGFSETPMRTSVGGVYPVREQISPAGSYVRIPGAGPLGTLDSFTIQATIWPTTPGTRRQALVSQWDPATSSGYALFVDETGALAIMLGDGHGGAECLTTAHAMESRCWTIVAASYDARNREVRLYQEPLARTGAGERAVGASMTVGFDARYSGSAALLFGAWTVDDPTARTPIRGHYNGKIERPRLSRAALGRLDIEKLRGVSIPAELRTDVVGFWDFSLDIPTTIVRDLSPHRLDGEIVNLPARAMTGSNWTGEEDNWRHAPEQYGAIHFHDDDIYDAGWQPTIAFVVPDDFRSGCYAFRVRSGVLEDRIPFFVRPQRGKPTARVAYLASTATYMAYANLNPVPFDIAELFSNRLLMLHDANLLIDEHPEWGPSLYDVHSDGSGVCYSSFLRPILNMRPGYISQFGGKGSSLREFNADTHILDWLDATGQAFDVFTDEDLHREGLALLKSYPVVMTGAHPEYFSTVMWDATKAYLDGGGRMMVMGGNGFYWRIAFHTQLPGVMEVRRSGPAIRTWETEPGEAVQSFDGQRGGLWRAVGRAPQSIAGVGFIAEGFDIGTYYARNPDSFDPRAAFIFAGVGAEERIGDFGLQGGGAAGIEIDHADRRLGTPSHALVLATSVGHSEAYRLVNEEISISIPNVTGTTNARIAADMVFFETPNDGAVFNTGSIAWAGSLSHSGYANNVSAITRNVLDRFLDEAPFGRTAPGSP